jgi:hypothetical protein
MRTMPALDWRAEWVVGLVGFQAVGMDTFAPRITFPRFAAAKTPIRHGTALTSLTCRLVVRQLCCHWPSARPARRTWHTSTAADSGVRSDDTYRAIAMNTALGTLAGTRTNTASPRSSW